ncbi:MAG: HNH endonuclease [Myxococcales bacterium]|nr:HNH endonuclease [Myxococcales bacterium]
MGYSDERLQLIFEKTDGHCHLCGKRLSWANYGVFSARGAWEVEHSVPRAVGGTDHLNNLFAACISCNRDKKAGSTRAARAYHGRKAAPLSAAKKDEHRRANTANGTAVGGLGALLFGASGPAAWFAAAVGAFVGHSIEPDPQKGRRRRR